MLRKDKEGTVKEVAPIVPDFWVADYTQQYDIGHGEEWNYDIHAEYGYNRYAGVVEAFLKHMYTWYTGKPKNLSCI